MRYILIPAEDGYRAHINVDPDGMNLPEDAEMFDSREEFDERREDFEAQ